MDRLVLTDEQWKRVAPHLPGKVGDPGRSEADNRMFMEGVLRIARRYDKTDQSFAALINLVAIAMAIK